MQKWEYCMVHQRLHGHPYVEYLRVSGVEAQWLELDKGDKAAYKEWKRERKRSPVGTSEKRYLLEQCICQLLAEGWELWQSTPIVYGSSESHFVHTFRRQVQVE
ncbi:MAG: hypothetical protein GTO63_16235 [Anaerolineae bacterium]|nr:hypothetical protein [Anaerolineae bacterium]NIN96365.1 hypothetical protein [Anaerolineae bacterium]NIQ79400.1 hypothetical protein [Anaerolineae bacterium]